MIFLRLRGASAAGRGLADEMAELFVVHEAELVEGDEDGGVLLPSFPPPEEEAVVHVGEPDVLLDSRDAPGQDLAQLLGEKAALPTAPLNVAQERTPSACAADQTARLLRATRGQGRGPSRGCQGEGRPGGLRGPGALGRAFPR